jgi:glycosyltransferase involved in cell wall biosynthesis
MKNSKLPSISVIIPAYKARKYLAECLDSVGNQTLLPSEVLVIDDASPEPVDDIIYDFANRKNYPSIRLINHEVNRGQAAARNTGTHESNGEYLAFIDCDDVWAPNHLEQAMDSLKQKNIDLVFCPATLFEDSIQAPLLFIEQPKDDAERRIEPLALLSRCFIIMSSVVARKESIQSHGGFDESTNMRAVEDLDLFMRMLKNGSKFAMAPESTIFYRKHLDSATGRPGYMAFQSAWVRQQHFQSVPGHWFQKRSIVAYHWWQAWLVFLSIDETRWDILARAIWQSLPMPHQIARGTIRTIRIIFQRVVR